MDRSPARSIEELAAPLVGTTSILDRPDGTKIAYVDVGEGQKVVVLVHGFGVDSGTWTIVQRQLLELGWRVITYDHRGHGRSTIGTAGLGSSQMAGDFSALAEALDLQHAAVACHSMGNFITIRALSDPAVCERFDRAIFVNPIVGSAGKGTISVKIQAPLVKMGLAQRLARSKRVGALLVKPALGPDASPALIEVSRLGMMNTPVAVAPCIDMLTNETVTPLLSQLKIEARVLTSHEDNTTPAWHAELIAANIPGASIQYIPRVGHMIPLEAPEAVISAITA